MYPGHNLLQLSKYYLYSEEVHFMTDESTY